MNITIFYHYDKIITNRNFKTQIMTKTRALVYDELYGSMAKWIKHVSFNIPTYRKKSSNIERSIVSVKFMFRCRKVSTP